ncbi:hypothetical protein DHEL01_v211479 [Diaporthe helianthi]|uniref:FAD-binding domain-containing protein n=1 Tax=Diaporthe helianthi TaxID=158607 RepID=A0A2P5HIQ6_DIAHE|nr:hypothetical protein DHEL01_v211479 [Diaporthe helianthi]
MGDFKSKFHVYIIGAGIVGLSGGIFLRRHGFQVTIVEKDIELQTIGAGIQLHPNALRVLQDLDVYDSLRAKSIVVQAIVLKDYVTGETLHAQDLTGVESQYGVPVLTVHRAHVRQILYDKAIEMGVHVHFGCAINARDIDLGGGRVDLRGPDGAPKSISADLFIGADGANSTMREAIMGSKREVIPHGKVVLRIVIEEELLKARDNLWSLVEDPKIVVWLGPESQAVTYSLGGVFNIAITRPGSLDPVDAFFGPKPVDLDHFRTELSAEGWDARLCELVSLGKGCQQWMLFQPEIDGEQAPWRDVGGKFCIVGDAAHQTLPYLAQGAAMGLESISVLACLLGSAQSQHEVKDLLGIFEHVRKVRTAHVIRAGLKNGAMWQLANGPLKDERDRVLLSETPTPGFPNLLADPFFQSWLWDFDASSTAGKAREMFLSSSPVERELV